MLATVVCAMLCGARSYSALAQWIHDQEPEFWHLLGFTRRPPKLGAFRQLLMKLSPPALEAVLRPWVEHLLDRPVPQDDQALQAVALDGKSLRGTWAEYGRALHLLSVLDQGTGFTLAQLEVDGQTNEHKTALSLLKTLLLKGRVVTGDTLFCQRDLCQQIVNQGHGRCERRRLEASTRLAEHLDWPGVAQVCRIQRWRKGHGPAEQQVTYAITSAPRAHADAATLLAWNRGHWGIENRSHYVRDVTLGEDASQIRKGSAPQVLASLRNGLLTWLRAHGAANIAAALRTNACQVTRLFTKLGIMKK
jgi:predicted transposase YbfD/YdcC